MSKSIHPFDKILLEIESKNAWTGEITLQRNEYLKVKGGIDTNLYFVNDGCMRIFVYLEENDHTIRFAYKGNLFAALDSYITEKPSDLYIQAIKKTSLKTLSKTRFLTILKDSPELINDWQNILEALILQQLEREKDLLVISPQHRYNRVLKRSPHLFQLIPHKYIAAYLRMTPETLSRLKKS